MAKRRSKKTDKDKLTLRGESIKFKVQENREKAFVTLNYTRQDANGIKEMNTNFWVFAIWMDNDNGNAIKAHLYANKANPQHKALVADLRRCGTMKFGFTDFDLTTDGTYMRYGKSLKNKYETYNNDTSQRNTVYDSKAQALAVILEQVQKSQTIGGLNTVSLTRLPDAVLKEMGYEEVPDLMKKRGVSMWKGNPVQAIGQEYGLDAQKQRKQFLDLLGTAINIAS